MAEPARTIAELLAARARAHPERAAIRAPGREPLRYGDLHAATVRVHTSLRERGIGARDRVALVLPNGPEMAVAFLAVASAATCAPLNPASTEAELAASLGDLGVKLLIAGDDPHPPAIAAARRLGLQVLRARAIGDAPAGVFELQASGGTAAVTSPGARAAADEPGVADVALVLQTSGTTARPKVVPLTQRNLCASAANIGRSLALGDTDVCLNVMPLFHIHGLMAALLASISAGASVICTPGFRAAAFEAWLRELAPTWYTAVPTIHQAVLETQADRRAIAGSLRLVRSSSAPLPPRVLHELEQRFAVPIVEAYGMTEASHQVANNPLAAGTQKAGSVGLPAGPEVGVMDESGRLLGRGQVGELVIRGETVTAGYENAPAANATAFTDGWFRTGDQGYVDADGYVFLTGRLKELINRGGEKIAPREVEEALLRHPAVAQAVAFAAPHARLGEEVAAAIVLRGGASASGDELRRAAGAVLAPFKVPRRIEIVAEIPKGATGKVQRSGLAEVLGLLDRPIDAGPAPRSALERRIAAIWSQLLDRESVGLDGDFFALGGDSLAAAELLEQMEELLGIEVPIGDFLDRPTIAGLIELRERSATLARPSAPDLVSLRSGGAEPPIFCIAGHDGSQWGVGRLARHVPIDCPIYGFTAPPVEARGPIPTIEDLAARYLATLERVQPEGPVRLIGSCFGGAVALAMAIRLEREGRPVELLALINSFNRAWRRTSGGTSPVKLRARHLLERLRLHGQRLRSRSRGERIAYLRARLELARSHWTIEAERLLFEVATASGLPRPAALRKIAYASRHAQRSYVARPYAGDVFLVRAIAPIAGIYPLPHMGWAGALRGEVELVELPCEQLEFWGDDSILRQVALRIGDRLERARRSAA